MNLKKVKLFIFLILLICAVFFQTEAAQAAFGIQPPHVKTNKPIFPGTYYEQQITLLRSSADEEMEAIIKINAPDIANWITIDKGEVFDLPRDQLKVPMIVKIDVPDKAEIGNYHGYINIQVAPKNRNTGGGVAIALGARVDIELSITNETFLDFEVRSFEIPDFEVFKKPWSWKIFSTFFYRIKTAITIKNLGNVKVAPTKAVLEVFDLNKTVLLEESEYKKIKKVDPFKTETVYASFPTKLGVGQYWGRIKVYRDDEIIYKNEAIFSIHSPGTIKGGVAIGIWPWLMLFGIILLLASALFVLIKIKIWRYLFRMIFILSWPLRFLYIRTVYYWRRLKKSFWRKVHQKAAKYGELPKDKDK